MAVYLPSAGDYEAALRMMGPASGLEAFERGRDRNIRRAAMLQGIRMQNEQLEMRKAAVEKADAQQAANYLAAEFGGGGYEGALYGAGSRGRPRGRSTTRTQGLGVDPATNIDAIRALEDEATRAAVAESREIEASQRLLAKEQAEQFRLQDQVRAQRQALVPTQEPRVLVGDAIVAAEEQRKKEALAKLRLSQIASVLQGTPPTAESVGLPGTPGIPGAGLGDLSAEEIDQFARERGINPLLLARGLAAPGMYPGTALTSSGDPRLLKAIEEFKLRQALAPGRPKDISEPEWQALKKERAGYSKWGSKERGQALKKELAPLYWTEEGRLGGSRRAPLVVKGLGIPDRPIPFGERSGYYNPLTGGPVPKDPKNIVEDAGIAGRTRLWRADQLKSFSEDQILAFGGQKRVHKGETTYWLPEALTPLLEKGGPVDDTGGQAGVGSLASLDERLRTSRGKASDLKLSIRKLKRSRAGSALKNPFEEFGKPSTFMPSIQTVSYAVDMARGGRPGGTDLIAQMIGRVPYPSEIRKLNELVSDYQDFAGGVSAKRTEITKGRVKTAQDALDEQKFTQQRRFSVMTRDLLSGSIRGASPEFLDYASDNLGTLWGEYPEDAQKLLTKYVNMGEAERKRFVDRQKAHRSKKGSGGSVLGDWGEMKIGGMRTAATAAGADVETQQALIVGIRKNLTDVVKGIPPSAWGESGPPKVGDDLTKIAPLPKLKGVDTESQREYQNIWNTARGEIARADKQLKAAQEEERTWRGRIDAVMAGIPQREFRARRGLSTRLSSEANAYVTEKDLRWDKDKRGWRRWDEKKKKWDARDRVYTADEIEGHVAATARQSER
jgi:hypothetical protein